MSKSMIAASALLALAVSAPPASASLIGGNALVRYVVDGTVVDEGAKDIADGTTFDFEKEGIAVSISDDQITVTNLEERTFGFANFDFNGIELYYEPVIPPSGILRSVVEDSTSDHQFANGSVLTLQGSEVEGKPFISGLTLNLATTCLGCNGGEKIILDATADRTSGGATPIPEPASAALIGTGLLGLCLAARRRSVGMARQCFSLWSSTTRVS